MNPVIGLDVSKGESQVQAFLDKGKPFGKSFSVSHTTEGLDALLHYLKVVENETGIKPSVILESTGHYHTPVIQFLEEQNYLYIMINPLLSYQAKKSSLRNVKTDEIDAFRLCELYYKEELEPYKKRGIQRLNLRHLTRQHETLTGLYVQAKLQFHAILDQVFPEYKGVFGDLYSKVSLNILLEFSTSESVVQAGENKVTDKIASLCMSRSERWAQERAKKLYEAAQRNPFKSIVYQSHLISLEMYIQLLLQYQEHLAKLDDQIDALAGEIEEYKIIQSIPGIGEKIAATIISEIGEIERFNHPKKLVAFSGIDPSVHSSGKFTATINRITKRGSSRLRHALYMAVLCGIRSSRNKKLKEFYDRKREEGKPFKVAMIACVNKLIHWIYALLKRKEAFLDLA
ncbi:IS110 family transposase [Metabacillus sediminilitoris]|uniref:IS110 family transposase n=1 Tax=Metabacillus sediminilitoris TaxID=2567941 RepID=A0A4S4BGV2_9BACI|nr:IS110 family transposase [Metabacillus sediminilitoris]QGQ44853.1 IS110 family transposase [Metabacillus sediminilitoris]QGQ45775.1 IS110 family transposase [Metabacillus sediminilitoris]THF73704.1 IS110 family transposase [Metabacillus sediminilitoris]